MGGGQSALAARDTAHVTGHVSGQIDLQRHLSPVRTAMLTTFAPLAGRLMNLEIALIKVIYYFKNCC